MQGKSSHGSVAEYRDVDGIARDEVLASGSGEYGQTFELVRVTPGWKLAGSCARWSDERFACRTTFRDGVQSGRTFLTLDEARDYFARYHVVSPVERGV